MRCAALLACLLLACGPLGLASGAHAQKASDAWTPDVDMLGEMDAQVVQLKLKGATTSLENYPRYYRGTRRDGRLFIEGYFGPFHTTGLKTPVSDDLSKRVHTVTSATPSLNNAGCQVVFLLYDVSSETFTSIQCQGEAASSPGH